MKISVLSLLSLFFLSSFFFTGSALGTPGERDFSEDELIVKFRKGVSVTAQEKIHKKHRSRVIKKMLGRDLDLVGIDPALSVEEAVQYYNTESAVVYAEPNYRIYQDGDLLPNDPFYGYLWNLKNIGQTGGAVGADIDAPRAWRFTTGSDKVVVAVIDSGVDYNHEDLSRNMWINSDEFYGIPGIDDDGNGYADDIYGIDTYSHTAEPMDTLGHGTHIAGIIGAVGGNGTGLVGVNWDVKIMTCRFLGPYGFGSVSGAIECLDYVMEMKKRGYEIVATNHSWGTSAYSQALYDALAAQQDILCFASAGNLGSDNDQSPYYPAAYVLPHVIAVASTDHNDSKAASSNFGRRSVHIGAPGVDILSTLPFWTHWGASLYGYLSGTSMAAPHAAGVAALIKAKHKQRDWRAIKNLILAGGDPAASLDGITVTGRRLNAARSLKCNNAPVFSVVRTPTEFLAGEAAQLAVLSIDCESPVGPVYMSTSQGEVVEFFDDGKGDDAAAGDGVFSASWIVDTVSESLFFSSYAGEEVIQTR